MLTGVNAIGVGEASGMFPVDSEKLCYDQVMLEKFRKLVSDRNLPWTLEEVLPNMKIYITDGKTQSLLPLESFNTFGTAKEDAANEKSE